MITVRTAARWSLPFAAGAFASRAFAPWEWWWTLPPALMLLFHLWRRDRSPRRAFADGWLWGMGLYSFGLFWLHISIDQYGNLGTPAAIAIALVFIAYLALFPALSGWLVVRLRSPSPARDLVWLMPAAFVLGEWLRGWLFTGFPWLLIGYAPIDTPLAALAPLGGVWLLGWLVAWLSALLLAAISVPERWPRALLGAVTLGLWLGLPWLREQSWTEPAGAAFTVAIVQPNIAQRDKWKPGQFRPTLRLFERLSQPAIGKARLILWPETAIPAFLRQIDRYWLNPLAARMREAGSDLLLGIPVRQSGAPNYYNAVVRPATGRDPVALYAKRHLVPFGEYAPLAALTRPVIDALGIPMASFSAGSGDARPLLVAAGHPAGISICYEDLFGDEVLAALPGAAYLVNVSNDAWFGRSAAPWQHLRMARMRALETGRYLVRATNTGVSAIIGPDGGLRAVSGLMTRERLEGEITPMRGLTPYARIGAGAVPVALAMLVAGLAFSRWRNGSRRIPGFHADDPSRE